MRLLDFIGQIANNIVAHKLRSFLAIAGIVWGAYAVLMLSAIGEGITQHNQEAIQLISKPSLFVWVNKTTIPYGGFPPGRMLAFSLQDILNLPRVFPREVLAVSPFASRQMNLMGNGQTMKTANVGGVSPEHFEISPEHFQGRIFTQEDITQSKRNIFLDSSAAKYLFDTASPLGKEVDVNGVPFTVVGYVPDQQGHGADFGYSYVPYTTFMSLWWGGDQRIYTFQVLLADHVGAEYFQKKLLHYLAYRYDFSPKDKAAISSWSTTSITKTVNVFFLIVECFLIFCGIMTLGVGGVGVANMMYFIVQERTRQIGLVMALGARPKDILYLVLGETIFLIGIGSGIGILAANATLSVLQKITLPDWLGVPVLTWNISLIVAGILFATAVMAGTFPARKAAFMIPVEALND